MPKIKEKTAYDVIDIKELCCSIRGFVSVDQALEELGIGHRELVKHMEGTAMRFIPMRTLNYYLSELDVALIAMRLKNQEKRQRQY